MYRSERYEILMENAQKKFLVADRFLNFTYKIVTEPKLLMGVVENIFTALTESMNALLYFELKYKFVEPFRDNLDSKIAAFRTLGKKYAVVESMVPLVLKLERIVNSHKTCPTEFVKDKSIIMCTENFDCQKLTFEMTVEYFKKAKVFIEEIQKIILKNERDYRRFS